MAATSESAEQPSVGETLDTRLIISIFELRQRSATDTDCVQMTGLRMKMSMMASQPAGIRRLLQQLAVCMLMQVRCLTLSAICFVKHCVMQKPPKPYCHHSMAGCGRDKSRDNATSLMRVIYSGEHSLPLHRTLSLPTLAGKNSFLYVSGGGEFSDATMVGQLNCPTR